MNEHIMASALLMPNFFSKPCEGLQLISCFGWDTVQARFPMQILPVRGVALVCFFLYLFIVGFSNVGGKTVEVVGVGDCADCAENNLETSQAFSGLRVNIDCKPENGKYFKTRGSGELDKEGNFKVTLPEEMVKDGELREECYAQLHSVSIEPCPTHDGMESVKIVLKSSSDEKHNFGLKGKLRFSPNHPPLPTFPFLPLKGFLHHHSIFPPIYKKPLPLSVPVSKPPPVPGYEKPLPPAVPIYKPPPVPVYKKPHPPPVPIYKKPHQPPVPVYKSPVYKSPPAPIHKKPLPPPIPLYKKPLPPPVRVYKKPLPPPIPAYKPKPHPPLPKLPPFPKKSCPVLPKLPPFPKYFHHHPKFGKWPPFSHHHP
ncbi:hypothetical protein F3Y22_tig00109972pilonHSYRG00041 [Hibiscus syriacus]|uniref:Proline-rich protein 4 n=1 Tax=Hibiscus syriacus TaxID=106335 RepID=A0A6A3BT81_HIBSY|nr:hypothetical protein F3Y22_tig00109972pilonHSYRG00041 [Hibiscus syriacus]